LHDYFTDTDADEKGVQLKPVVIVMEMCEGTSLQEYSSRRDEGRVDSQGYPLPYPPTGMPHLYPGVALKGLLKMTEEILLGLQFLHERNVIHRDLKPENIMIRYDDDDVPHCTVVDLGLSRVDEGQDVQKTEDTGTILYRAPEQFSTLRTQYGTAVDVWALGITLSQIVSHECVLHDPQSIPDLTFTLEQKRVRRLLPGESGVPGYDELVNSMLEYDPTLRPTCTQLLTDVHALMAQGKQGRTTPTLTPPALPTLVPAPAPPLGVPLQKSYMVAYGVFTSAGNLPVVEALLHGKEHGSGPIAVITRKEGALKHAATGSVEVPLTQSGPALGRALESGVCMSSMQAIVVYKTKLKTLSKAMGRDLTQSLTDVYWGMWEGKATYQQIDDIPVVVYGTVDPSERKTYVTLIRACRKTALTAVGKRIDAAAEER
ncbi:hypothetical protein KIPB_000858, partial [Kipferlia bialata]